MDCLIVDDVTVTRFIARTFLENLGVGVIEAEDGDGALNTLESNQNVDVILLDWHLKKKSGVELLQVIREKHGNDIKVVLFSGVEDGDKLQEAKEAGANAYISKPTTQEKIKDCFQDLGLLFV